MSSTEPLSLGQLVRLPWTFQGPSRDPDGGFVIRIGELPGFVVAAETRHQVFEDLRPALKAFLASYTEHGETPTLPSNRDAWRMTLGRGANSAGVKAETVAVTVTGRPNHRQSVQLA
jgi:predicted RNase H-like HicB family nuclease